MAMIDDYARQRDTSRSRLLLLIGGFALLATIVLIRLMYLQVLRADDYRQQLDDWLVLQPDYLPPLRGDIHDRRDDHVPLAQDVPSWQIEAYYGILDKRPVANGRNSYAKYVRDQARRLRRAGQLPTDVPLDASAEIIDQRIDESWQMLADLTHQPAAQLAQTSDIIVDRVRAIRARVAERRGVDEDAAEQDVAEQRQFHPVVKDLPAELANQLRLGLAGSPWFRVHTSTSRQYTEDPWISQLVGRLKEVSREALDSDPNSEDELRALQPGDKIGESGVEYAAEGFLRGQRGKTKRNRAGEYLENIEPVRGRDVHLTIDLDLQRWIYDQLGQAVHECSTASSAAAVVLDVDTREIRAAVSWPGYKPSDYTDSYDQLARDMIHLPLRNHAFADSYPAGSIVKPVTIMAALNTGLASPDERIDCTGYLNPNSKTSFRCWTTSRGMPGHGALTAQEAIMHSCNVYCYTMGRRLGVERFHEWFSLFGLGRPPGSGLLEEAVGLVPTPDRYGNRQAEMNAAAQNLAIGQGDLTLTPVQAANLGATVATGVWQPVTLLVEQADAHRAARQRLPGNAGSWRIAREGMFGVVNDPAGTAYNHARSEGVQIAGKTGTAETGPRPVGFVYELKLYDGSTRTMEFTSKAAAADKIAQMGESVVKWELTDTKYWPGPYDPEHKPTHAWFLGFAPAHKPQVAVAVLIEYGGGGGRTAGPVARDIFEHIFGVEGQHPHAAADPGLAD